MDSSGMEAKLKEFRKERKKQEIKNNIRNTVSLIYGKLFPPSDIRPSKSSATVQASVAPDVTPLLDLESPMKSTTPKTLKNVKTEPLSWQIKLFYFSFWAVSYYFFIYIEFGAIYLILSMLIGVWLNTRTEEKVDGEVSAYSVFNPNCEAIDGTLNAEQFDKQIRSGFL